MDLDCPMDRRKFRASKWIEVKVKEAAYIFDNLNPNGVKKSDYFGHYRMAVSGADGLKSGKHIQESAKTVKTINIK